MFNEIITKSIRAVCEAFSVQAKVLYNSHTENATALRWCAVGVLSEYFSDLQLSEVLPIGRKCINKIRNAYVRRFRRWSERQMLDEVRKIIVAVIGE